MLKHLSSFLNCCENNNKEQGTEENFNDKKPIKSSRSVPSNSHRSNKNYYQSGFKKQDGSNNNFVSPVPKTKQ